MKTHEIHVKAMFTAVVEIEASTYEQAQKIAKDNFGCVGPTWQDGGHTSIRSWDAPVHPTEKTVLTPVDALCSKKDDGGFARGNGHAAHFARLTARAKEVRVRGEIATLGGLILDWFSANKWMTSLRIKVEDSGWQIPAQVTVGHDLATSEIEASDLLREAITESIESFRLYRTLVEVSTCGEILIERQHLGAFLDLDSVSAIDVIKHLATIPETEFKGNLSSMEALYA